MTKEIFKGKVMKSFLFQGHRFGNLIEKLRKTLGKDITNSKFLKIFPVAVWIVD